MKLMPDSIQTIVDAVQNDGRGLEVLEYHGADGRRLAAAQARVTLAWRSPGSTTSSPRKTSME